MCTDIPCGAHACRSGQLVVGKRRLVYKNKIKQNKKLLLTFCKSVTYASNAEDLNKPILILLQIKINSKSQHHYHVVWAPKAEPSCASGLCFPERTAAYNMATTDYSLQHHSHIHSHCTANHAHLFHFFSQSLSHYLGSSLCVLLCQACVEIMPRSVLFMFMLHIPMLNVLLVVFV